MEMGAWAFARGRSGPRGEAVVVLDLRALSFQSYLPLGCLGAAWKWSTFLPGKPERVNWEPRSQFWPADIFLFSFVLFCL